MRVLSKLVVIIASLTLAVVFSLQGEGAEVEEGEHWENYELGIRN